MAIEKVTEVLIWRSKESRIAKTTLKKKKHFFKLERAIIPDIKIYCKTTTIKTVYTTVRQTISLVEQNGNLTYIAFYRTTCISTLDS